MPNVDMMMARRKTVAATRVAMLEVANEWKGTPYLMSGNSKNGIDCSHFVYQVLNGAREKAADIGHTPQLVDYRNTATIEDSKLFLPVSIPEPGDLVLWDSHIGIVVDPVSGTFIGAQTSTGVAEAKYSSGYWSNKPNKRFIRFIHFM